MSDIYSDLNENFFILNEPFSLLKYLMNEYKLRGEIQYEKRRFETGIRHTE